MSATKKYQATGTAPPWGGSWTQKQQTYDAVKASGDEGITREDICKKTNLPKQRVWFYLSELRRAGLIKRMGDAIDPSTLSATDAKLHAMAAMENAFGAAVSEMKFSKPLEKDPVYIEINRSLMRYNKIKALALGAKTKGEETAALRQAMVDLVKMVF